ncbi:MAG: rhodanese-like domain-containing protein, partial [Candidatus Sericytochromatia bacterium]
MSTTTLPNEISPRQLFDLMERPETPFLLLDVRNEEEFAAWRIEGKHQPETIHIPYFDFLEDEAASVEKLRAHQGKPIVVVCAKGGSSDYVAGVLRENGFTASNLEGGMIAWGDLLIPVDVPSREGLVIKQLQRVGKGCVSYFIGNRDGAIIVDPARHIAPYTALADELGMPIKIVFDTHLHADHISGGPELAEATGARYLIDAHDAEGAKMKFEAIEPGHVE